MSNGRPFTPDDGAKLRRLVASGMTQAQIGAEMQRHEKFIQAKCSELGIEPGVPRALRAMLARVNLRRLVRARA